MNKYIFSSLAIASVLVSYPLAARGAILANCVNTPGFVTCTANIPSRLVPWTEKITIPQYNPADHGGAELDGIDLKANVGFTGDYTIRNLEPLDPLIYGDVNDDVGVRAIINGTGFSTPLQPIAFDNIGMGTLAPLQSRNYPVMGTSTGQTTVTPAQLGVYEGAGTIEFNAQLRKYFNVNADGGFTQDTNANAFLNLEIIYKFKEPTSEIDEPNLGAFSTLACVLGVFFLRTRKNEP